MKKISEIQKMSIEQLEQLMREAEFDTRDRVIISTEINTRLLKALKEPHWSTTPLFWVYVVAAVAACIAAYPVLFPAQAPQSVQVAPPAPTAAGVSQTQSTRVRRKP
jgi:hypothetical protein